MDEQLTSSFAELLGRQPTEAEQKRLYQVKNALNIHNNDALWLILMALESYNTLYEQYPARIARDVERLVNRQQAVLKSMALTETKKAHADLSAAVVEASKAITTSQAHATLMLSVGWAVFAVTLFGVLCVFVGYILGSGQVPFWAAPVQEHANLASFIAASLVRTPAGWLIAGGAALAACGAIWTQREQILSKQKTGKQWILVAVSVVLILAATVSIALIFV